MQQNNSKEVKLLVQILLMTPVHIMLTLMLSANSGKSFLKRADTSSAACLPIDTVDVTLTFTCQYGSQVCKHSLKHCVIFRILGSDSELQQTIRTYIWKSLQIVFCTYA